MEKMIPYFTLVHVVCAFFWVGANWFLSLFFYPSVLRNREAGNKLTMDISSVGKLPMYMMLASILVIITGLGIFDYISHHFSNSEFMSSRRGITLSIGMLLALASFFHGFFLIRNKATKIGLLSQKMLSDNSSIETGEEINKLFMSIVRATKMEGWIMLATLITMIMAKYF